MSEVAERIKNLIADYLDVEEHRVTESTRIMADLGADSLDVIELVIALEDEFRCEIPDEEAEKMMSVKDVIIFIEAALSRQVKDDYAEGISEAQIA